MLQTGVKVDTVRGAVNFDFPFGTTTDGANLPAFCRAEALGLSRLTERAFHFDDRCKSKGRPRPGAPVLAGPPKGRTTNRATCFSCQCSYYLCTMHVAHR